MRESKKFVISSEPNFANFHPRNTLRQKIISLLMPFRKIARIFLKSLHLLK